MIHLAGLGDYTFVMRRLIMWPLARDQGIASLILQVPFYGDRKPAWQRGTKLEHVSDLLSAGNATIEASSKHNLPRSLDLALTPSHHLDRQF